MSLPQPAIIDKTLHALTKWKGRRQRDSKSFSVRHIDNLDFRSRHTKSPVANSSRLPNEIYEQILASVGYDIPLIPNHIDRLKYPEHFHKYFQLVDSKVRARNQTLRNCRLVSRVWNEIASRSLNAYLVIHAESWKCHRIWRNEAFRKQVRHVWIIPTNPWRRMDLRQNPYRGLFARIFTRFPELETLYACFKDCHLNFFNEHASQLHVPPNLRILGLDGPSLEGSGVASMEDLQIAILRKFPRLESLIEVGSSRSDFIIVNGDVRDVGCSSIKANFSSSLTIPYFARLQSLSLTGGYLVQDQSIVSLVSLCPPIRSLRVCGLDCRFTMRGLEHLLEKVGSELESLHLAIRQSEQLWGDGTSHLCHILARTCSNVKYLHIGEEDSLNRCIRSTSCCCDLFDLAQWENLVDCHLCVYPGRGGCLDRSDGSLTALVESARIVALRNSKGLGTIIRIKVDYLSNGEAIWVTTTDTMTRFTEPEGNEQST